VSGTKSKEVHRAIEHGGITLRLGQGNGPLAGGFRSRREQQCVMYGSKEE
jgi:hypothetical protein